MKIKINNSEYEIIFVPEYDERVKMDDGAYHSGVTDLRNQKIYIQNNLNPHQLVFTIRHELSHAYQEAYGFLQVEWNDEIVSDFIAIYGDKINEDTVRILKFYRN